MKKLFFAICTFISIAYAHAQNSPSQKRVIDFTNAQVDLAFTAASKEIKGSVIYNLTVLKDTDSLFIDAKNVVDYSVLLNNAPVETAYNKEIIVLRSRFRESEQHTITLQFTTKPSSALYFIDSDGDAVWDQLWTQGQGKYTSNWLPSIDDMNDKIIWNFTITAPVKYQVLANGLLVNSEQLGAVKKWQYSMSQPMSSYLVAVVVGDYKAQKMVSASSTPLSLYYYPADSLKVASTYANTLQIFNFLESEIGVRYPWGDYKQVPVKDFLYSGMENTSLTIFSDEFVNDALGAIDKPYTNVNAHELAHQWFGNLVTEASGTDHWLHEGFASYYALLAERDLYGDDYFYMQLYNNAEKLYEQVQKGEATALLDATGSSLTFYEHGAWALHALRELVGDLAYRQSIVNYLNIYGYRNVTTDDFLKIVAGVSGKDLTAYKALWLTNKDFPLAESLRLLRKSPFMSTYLQLAARRESSYDEALKSYEEVLYAPKPNYFLLQETVAQLNLHKDSRKFDLLKIAASSKDVLLRQTIALTTQELTFGNQQIIENMLDDASYVTREQVLFLLWSNNVTKRKELLQKAQKMWTQTNPSLQMAHAALALNTPEFSKADLLQYMKNLQQFSRPQHSIATRTAAFDYLVNMGIMDEQNYKDLIQATLHHNWRFYSYARDLLRSQFKQEQELPLIESAVKKFKPQEQDRLRAILTSR